MRCNHCRREAILFQPYSGQHLCEHHFILDVERRAKRIIRKNRWVSSGDRIALSVEANGSSQALRHFLASSFGPRRDLTFLLLELDPEVDEDIPSEFAELVREGRLQYIQGPICGREEISSEKDSGKIPAQVSRQKLIQHIAREYHATRIAVGSTLEDEACDMLTDILQGDISHLNLPEATNEEIPLIRPFKEIPEEEIILYARLRTALHIHSTGVDPSPRPVGAVREEMKDFARRHPSVPFALAHLRTKLMYLGGKDGGDGHDTGSN
jgi:hypothetical protein